jgi:hypothetical protein
MSSAAQVIPEGFERGSDGDFGADPAGPRANSLPVSSDPYARLEAAILGATPEVNKTALHSWFPLLFCSSVASAIGRRGFLISIYFIAR